MADEHERLGDALLAMVQSLEDPAYLKDRQCRIVFANDALAKLMGVTPESLIGKSPQEMLPPESAAKVASDDLEVLRTGRELACEEALALPDGTERVFLTSKRPYRGPKGEIVGLIGISRDITAQKRTSELLRVSEERFRSMFEQAPFSIQLLSPDGRTTGFNAAWRQLWNATPELLQFVLTSYNLLEDPQLEAKGIMPWLRRAFAGEAVRAPAIYYDPEELGRGGTGRWVEGYFYPIRDARGVITEVVLLHNDITSQKEAELALKESEERYRTLIEGSPEVVFLTDLSSRMLFANKALEERVGYTAADFQMPQTENPFIHPEDAPRVSRFIADFIASGRQYSDRIENRFITRDGRVVWFSSVISRTTYKGESALQFATYDITARKRAEEELERLVDRERQARERAEAALQVREDFLSIAAHELKTPLTPLKMQVFALRRHLSEVLAEDPKAQALTKLIEGSDMQLDRLVRLADDLLEVSRINRGRLTLQLEPCDLAEVVEMTVGRFSAELGQAGCEVRLQAEPVDGWWDRQRVQRVVAILLSNALKFGKGRPIDIRVEARDTRAIFSVRDRGIGIPLEDQARIFRRFERAVSLRHFGGFGIGLYMARRLVEAHGGTIWVESEPGKGSTFTVELPARAAKG
jgi:PAS domain S-box-containing protein